MIIIVASSGSGKSELEKVLQRRHDYNKLISYTTRKPRIHEQNGVDYHFITRNEFHTLLNGGKFAENIEYMDNYYSAHIDDCKDNTVAVMVPEGLEQMKEYESKLSTKIMTVFIKVNPFVRMFRMLKRGDSLVSAIKRIYNDRKMFNSIKSNADIIINNNTNDYKDLDQIADRIDTEYKFYTLYQKLVDRSYHP